MKAFFWTLSLASLLFTFGCEEFDEHHHRGGDYGRPEYRTGAYRGYPDDYRGSPRDGDRSGAYRWDSYGQRWVPAESWHRDHDDDR